MKTSLAYRRYALLFGVLAAVAIASFLAAASAISARSPLKEVTTALDRAE
ncbi:MAG: hypothetical protein GY711_21025 [bacterium]|nr:hypothetical protein [bacterium]